MLDDNDTTDTTGTDSINDPGPAAGAAAPEGTDSAPPTGETEPGAATPDGDPAPATKTVKKAAKRAPRTRKTTVMPDVGAAPSSDASGAETTTQDAASGVDGPVGDGAAPATARTAKKAAAKRTTAKKTAAKKTAAKKSTAKTTTGGATKRSAKKAVTDEPKPEADQTLDAAPEITEPAGDPTVAEPLPTVARDQGEPQEQPDRSAGGPADELAGESEEELEEAPGDQLLEQGDASQTADEQVVPAAPSVLFQTPDPVTKPARRRRSTAATRAAAAAAALDGGDGDAGDDGGPAPEESDGSQAPGAPGATDDTEPDSTDEGSGDLESADGDDESGGNRRRRRRGGRRRRRGGSSDAGGDSDADSDADSDTGSDAGGERGGDTGSERGDAEDGDGSGADSGEETAGARGKGGRGGQRGQRNQRNRSGQRGGTDTSSDEDAEDGETGTTGPSDSEAAGDGAGSRRRRRRRRSGEEGDADAESDEPNTVTRVRKARSAEDEITSLHGSTRLEAKKQRRREGREAGRRRAPIVSEAEFLARREAVDRVMVIRQRADLTQIAVLEDKVLVEHYVARDSQTSLIGNVYLGRVQNVLPSMEAAFIDIGKGRNAVLYAGEVNWSALGAGNGPRKIEQVLKSGQPILVQVSKDPAGHKGARLTSQVSLPGRFLVYVPDGTTSGISRKLPDTERTRLKTLLKEIVPDSAGVIVRTAAEGASEEELTNDVERLTARWADIEAKVEKGNAPQLLYGEPDLTLKVVRDLFTEDFTSLVVSGDEAWDLVDTYVKHVAPDLEERIERWDGDGDVFAAYRIDEQIDKGLDRKVWLPSGGSLVIDRTEAMTVVDVNTGKFTGSGGNLEETVTKNNLEAAEEIVRQLRLRDIGGIIVVDFIDMVLEGNRDLVLRRMVECLGRDRTRHQVAEVTSLGLVQMTRKRIGTGLLEAFSENCEHCGGRGLVVHHEPVEARRKQEEEPRRAGRRGRNRGDAETDQGRGGGSSSGNGGGSNGGNGGGVRHAPSPADIAAIARQDVKRAEQPAAGGRSHDEAGDGSQTQVVETAGDPTPVASVPDQPASEPTQPEPAQPESAQPESAQGVAGDDVSDLALAVGAAPVLADRSESPAAAAPVTAGEAADGPDQGQVGVETAAPVATGPVVTSRRRVVRREAGTPAPTESPAPVQPDAAPTDRTDHGGDDQAAPAPGVTDTDGAVAEPVPAALVRVTSRRRGVRRAAGPPSGDPTPDGASRDGSGAADQDEATGAPGTGGVGDGQDGPEALDASSVSVGEQPHVPVKHSGGRRH